MGGVRVVRGSLRTRKHCLGGLRIYTRRFPFSVRPTSTTAESTSRRQRLVTSHQRLWRMPAVFGAAMLKLIISWYFVDAVALQEELDSNGWMRSGPLKARCGAVQCLCFMPAWYLFVALFRECLTRAHPALSGLYRTRPSFVVVPTEVLP